MKERWSVITVSKIYIVIVLALFKLLDDAIEYCAFVIDYDEPNFSSWSTFVVEGDFLNE